MIRTYAFAFRAEPEGGYTVTCPALPGLVTHGDDLAQARAMARDAMDGLVEIMLERGEKLPESDPPDALSRFGRLAQSLVDDEGDEPVFKALTAKIAERV